MMGSTSNRWHRCCSTGPTSNQMSWASQGSDYEEAEAANMKCSTRMFAMPCNGHGNKTVMEEAVIGNTHAINSFVQAVHMAQHAWLCFAALYRHRMPCSEVSSLNTLSSSVAYPRLNCLFCVCHSIYQSVCDLSQVLANLPCSNLVVNNVSAGKETHDDRTHDDKTHCCSNCIVNAVALHDQCCT